MFQRTAMNRTAIAANKLFKPAEPETTEYARIQKAFHDNRERLKSERLAREAAAQHAGARNPSS